MQLNPTEIVPGYEFTDPEHIASDLTSFAAMAEFIRKHHSGEPRIKSETATGIFHLYQAEQSILNRKFYGVLFAGQLREPLSADTWSRLEIGNEQLITEVLPLFPDIHFYISCKQPLQPWRNAVLATNQQALTNFAHHPLHLEISTKLGPEAYFGISLHFTDNCNLTPSPEFPLTRTMYHIYQPNGNILSATRNHLPAH